MNVTKDPLKATETLILKRTITIIYEHTWKVVFYAAYVIKEESKRKIPRYFV